LLRSIRDCTNQRAAKVSPRRRKRKVDSADANHDIGNRFGGVLYVLKGSAFVSIGLGGTDEEETKLKKSKTLAQKALQRL